MHPSLPPTLPAPLARSDVLSALSCALDLTEGQPVGHSLRACGIAMEIARRAGLDATQRETLYHAAILKDAGCSSNAARVFQLFGGDDHAAKRDLKRVDWSRYFDAARYAFAHAAPQAGWLARARRIVALAQAGPRAADELVEIRCTRGANIARQLGFGADVASAIASLDEHWDGHGRPMRLAREQIPVSSRVMLLAQTLDVFAWHDGPDAAIEIAAWRSGRWFEPGLVRACRGLAPELAAWRDRDLPALQRAVTALDPAPERTLAGDESLAGVAEAFASIVDAKSPFTHRHSRRMAALAMAIARELGAASELLRVAALLHDLGKLAVPNAILDKPGELSDEEWRIVRRHPADTLEILQRLEGMGQWAEVAAAHHERLDGRGYHLSLDAERLPLEARILAVADVYESLTSHRPYRSPMSHEMARAVLEHDRGTGFDAGCLEALDRALQRGLDGEAGSSEAWPHAA